MDLLAFNIPHIDFSSIEHWLEAGSYLVLFLILFSCGLGMPMPEDIPLFLAGYFVGQGKMNLALASICAWCGIIGGDVVLYHLGKKFGPSVSKLPLIGRHVNTARLAHVEGLFARYGIWVVGIGRMFAGIRAVMVLAAGTIRYSLLKFIIADGLGAIVSGGLFVFLGWLAGRYVGDRTLADFYKEEIEPYKTWFALGTGVLVLLIALYLWWRHKRHKTLIEAALDKVP